jgi:Cu(I)/Ag(I) efflux system membrane fusion protein
VADIYSPELLTAQRELLYLTENDKSNEELIRSAKSKLLLLGASEKQVDEIIARKEAVYTFSIFSAYDGYVISENQQAPAMVTASRPLPLHQWVVAWVMEVWGLPRRLLRHPVHSLMQS